jgi:hypothetical protein
VCLKPQHKTGPTAVGIACQPCQRFHAYRLAKPAIGSNLVTRGHPPFDLPRTRRPTVRTARGEGGSRWASLRHSGGSGCPASACAHRLWRRDGRRAESAGRATGGRRHAKSVHGQAKVAEVARLWDFRNSGEFRYFPQRGALVRRCGNHLSKNTPARLRPNRMSSAPFTGLPAQRSSARR